MAPKSTKEVLEAVKSTVTQLDDVQSGGKPKRGVKKTASKSKTVKKSKSKSRSQSRPKAKKVVKAKSKSKSKGAKKVRKVKSKSRSQSRPKTAKKAPSKTKTVKKVKSKSKSKSRSLKRAPNQYILDLTALRAYIKTQLPNETLNSVGAMSKAASKILSGADKDLAKAKKAFNSASFLKDYKSAAAEIDAKRKAKKASKA